MDEATLTSLEESTEQELNALFSENKETAAPAAGAGDSSSKQDQPVASPAGPAKADEEDPLLKALGEIEDSEPKQIEKKDGEPSSLTDDQKAVLDVIPDVESAKNLYHLVGQYQNFTDALSDGKFDNVENMLKEWKPEVLDAWLEHVYMTRVASGDWVDRFINENDPKKGEENKELTKLQKKLAALESQIKDKDEVKVKNSAAEKQTASFQAYNQHIDSLFDKINFNQADREWVVSSLNQKVAADPKVLEAVKSGNVKAVNTIFKQVCLAYVNRDKAVSNAKDVKLEKQNMKKPLLGGGGGEGSDILPDNIDEVPKDKRDSWATQQIQKLFRSKK